MPEPKMFSEEEYNEMVAQRDAVKLKNQEVIREERKLKEALKAYEGLDPEKYKQLETAAAEAERKKAAAEGDFKSLESQLKTLHKQELDGKEQRIGKLTKAVEKRAIRAELQAALVKAKAMPDMLDLLVERGERSARMKETDDDYVAYIADDKGNQLVSDGSGTPMDFDTFVEQKLKVQYPRAFEGSGSSGGGATKSAPSGGGSKVITSGDNSAFIANLADIAAGKTQVRDAS